MARRTQLRVYFSSSIPIFDPLSPRFFAPINFRRRVVPIFTQLFVAFEAGRVDGYKEMSFSSSIDNFLYGFVYVEFAIIIIHIDKNRKHYMYWFIIRRGYHFV